MVANLWGLTPRHMANFEGSVWREKLPRDESMLPAGNPNSHGNLSPSVRCRSVGV